MRRLRVGVVGVGFWGRNHARVLRKIPNANLVAVCDTEEEAARQVGEKFRVGWYTDLDQLLSREDLDAVTICTPTAAHADVALRTIERSKHLLIEKPVSSTVDEARLIVSAADKRGVHLMVGSIERFNPAVRQLKKMVKDGALGRLIFTMARRVSRRPERVEDVGIVRDSAIHDIDVMRYLLESEVETVYARTGSLKFKFEDYAEALLVFKSGNVGFIDANWLTPRKIRSLIATGSEATATIDYLSQKIVVEGLKKAKKIQPKWEEPLQAELKHFVNTILEDGEPIVTGQDGVQTLRICEAIIESGRTGEKIYLG